MKNTSIYISLMLVFLLLSCSKNEVEELDQGIKGFVIELKDSGTNTQTRATSVPLSEVIESINLFFDPIDASISPFIIGNNDIRIQESSGKYLAYFSLHDASLLDKDYKIYMVVNRDIPVGVTSFSMLQSAIITEDLNTVDTKYLLMSGQVKSSTGEVIHLATADTKLGNVTLVRVPSKISLEVTFTDKFNVGDCVANKYNIVGQKLVFNDYNTQGYYYNPNNIVKEKDALKDINKDVQFESAEKVLSSTLYSYPNQWKDDATRETYLMLMIEVKTDCAGPVTPLYYKIPIDGKNSSSVIQNNKELKANHNYILKVNIDQEGSTDPETPFELEGSYEIKEWELGDINTSIDEFHYLFVTPEYADLYNVNKQPFLAETSRLGVVAKDISVTASYYALNSAGQLVTSKYGDSSSLYDEFRSPAQFLQITGLPSDLKTIPFKGLIEPSQNNLIKDISFVVHQKADTEGVLDRKVVMKQYPAIAINTFWSLKSGIELFGGSWDIQWLLNLLGGGDSSPHRVYHFETHVPQGQLIKYPNTSVGKVTDYTGVIPLFDYTYTSIDRENMNFVSPSFMSSSTKSNFKFKPGGIFGLPVSGEEVVRLHCYFYYEETNITGVYEKYRKFRVPTKAELDLIADRQYNNKILMVQGTKALLQDGESYWTADGTYIYNEGLLEPNTNKNKESEVLCVRDIGK